MIRNALIAAAVAVGLAGCETLSQQEQQALRYGIAEAAVGMIAEANAEGINPVEMDEADLRIVHFACSAAQAFAPFVDAYIEARNVEDPDFEPVDFKGYVAAACAIADELIQPKEVDTGTSAVSPAPAA